MAFLSYMTLEQLAKMMLRHMNKESRDAFGMELEHLLNEENIGLEDFAMYVGLDETATFREIVNAYINRLVEEQGVQ